MARLDVGVVRAGLADHLHYACGFAESDEIVWASAISKRQVLRYPALVNLIENTIMQLSLAAVEAAIIRCSRRRHRAQDKLTKYFMAR